MTETCENIMTRKVSRKANYRVKGKIEFPLLLLLFMGCFPGLSAQSKTDEYRVKAAFIYKFTNYIEWDSNLPGNEFIIGVLGPSPIYTALTEIAKTKTVDGKRIKVISYENPEAIGPCHILLISQKSPYALYEVLTKISDKGTLTISEKKGYAAKGSAINFVQAGNLLKFEVNTRAISAAHLTASSQLLKLAILID